MKRQDNDGTDRMVAGITDNATSNELDKQAEKDITRKPNKSTAI